MTATPDQLAAAHTEVVAEIARADSKAGTLLAALGLPMAVLVVAVPGRHLDPVTSALTGLGAAGLIAAMLVTLDVIRPRIGGPVRGGFLHWATCDPGDVAASLTADHAPARLVKLSKIARRKYARLKIAIDITSGALGAFALALLAALAGI
ncbi:Pycsar system effector family protein [Streptomyces sp. NEAU-Y11]|uniref:Pycsar system effector family protein n=1 Tax=Streptomyces cucumeris TaxID=2962890 RepID=UPI0020C8DC92|nr:Pycsar system effector family protein [Streptomyces sp. NEAU-Y11]MCP9205517.1 DUF5706 domain-containing protein [Streptomyces sp. NEAU-Y11]